MNNKTIYDDESDEFLKNNKRNIHEKDDSQNIKKNRTSEYYDNSSKSSILNINLLKNKL